MKFDIVRAWKDEGYRQSLSEEERSSLPENPVGELELTDSDLEAVLGGGGYCYKKYYHKKYYHKKHYNYKKYCWSYSWSYSCN